MRSALAVGAALLLAMTAGAGATTAQMNVRHVTASQACGGDEWVCDYVASDDRVTGTLTIEFSGSAEDPAPSGADLAWADTSLEGPDGTWAGHYYLLWGDDGAQVFAVFDGEGGYEGWRYVASGVDPEADGDHDWIGVIYQGDLPGFGSEPPVADEQ